MDNELTLYNLCENCPLSSSLYVYCDDKEIHTTSASDIYKYACIICSEIETLSVSDSVICCLLKPSTDLLSILLGILKSSCAFAFLDFENPVKTLLRFQNFVNIKIQIIEESLFQGLSKLCTCWKKSAEFSIRSNYVIVEASVCTINTCPNFESLEKFKKYCGIAYVIQTSGTTSEAKVVQVPHGCIVPNVLDFRSRFNVSTTDVILQSTPLTFDPSVIEIFLALTCGASLVMVPEHVKRRSFKLSEIITENKITILQATPSLMSSFNEDILKNKILGDDSSIRLLLLGGETCPSVQKLKKWCTEKNKTEIYNLYGVTEVSCWASCFKIDLKSSAHMPHVPLGEPLLNTVLEIRSYSKDESFTELYIGSDTRFCIINDEDWPDNCKWFVRPTGDLVNQDSNYSLYFESRTDSIIKYKGRKISLQFLNNVLEDYVDISHHYLHFHSSDEKLFAFVVCDKSSLVSKSECRNKIIQILRENVAHLPAIEVISISNIPLTKHGKVDVSKLMLLTNMPQKRKQSYNCDDVLHTITSLWKVYINQDSVNEEDNFVLKGGDSISAVQFVADTEWELQISMPSLIEDLLNKSFKDVCDTVLLYLKNEMHVESCLHQYFSNFAPEVNPRKKIYRKCFQVCYKRGYHSYCFHDVTCLIPNTYGHDQKTDVYLDLIFKWDLKKCVDATPCIVYFCQRDLILAFIGSHSGLFSCLNVKDKTEIWQIFLPDRIESSACLSSCSDYVLFGCYDHHLYCVTVADGSIFWKVETGAEVKSSPVVSAQNIAFVGSHDKFIYAVNVENGNVLWKNRVSNGFVFASPAICEERKAVIVATLDGELAMLKMDTGEVLWKSHLRKPIFSSPVVVSDSVFVGSTDNCIFHFQLDGQMKQKLAVHGPVFSSAFVQDPSDEQVIFGCHDTYIYCISIHGGILWSAKCDSAVYATPFPFLWRNQRCVMVASTKGTLYILNGEDGKEVYSLHLPGELFSSPIVMHGIVVVGCRDNFIYFLSLR